MNAEWLLKVRPASLAALLKTVLRIERRVVTTREGFSLFLDPASHFGNEVLKTGGYEPELTALIQCLMRPGDTFLDVGANEGFFSVVASRASHNAKVWAIEPQSRLNPVVKKNLELNGATAAQVFHLALAEKSGTLTLQLTPNINTGASGMHKRWKVGGSTEKVRTETLDSFAAAYNLGHVRLVKIDCEGAEPHILKGADEFFRKQCCDFLSLDYHESIVGKLAAQGMDAQLRRWGYELAQAANGCWVYHKPGLETALTKLGPVKAIGPI